MAALAALTSRLIEGGAHGFTSPWVIGILVLAGVSLATFVVVERRVAHPMMPLTLFSSAGMRIALVVGFAFLAAWFGTVFVGSLYLQQHLRLSPLTTGLVFLPSAMFSIAGNLISGPVTNRFGTRIPVLAGLSAMVLGLTLMALTAPSPWHCGQFSLGLWLTFKGFKPCPITADLVPVDSPPTQPVVPV